MTVDILGVAFHAVTAAEAVRSLSEFLHTARNHIVVTPNPEIVMRARRSDALRQALCAADLRLADGVGIVLASRLLGCCLPEQVRGCDTAYALLKAESVRRRSVYFLGAKPGVAEAAGRNMARQFPGLRIVGCRDGYFSDEDERIILNELRALSPDILVLGLGVRQELWAAKHRDLPVRVTLCVGGTIDVMAGQVKRAPAIFQRLGLEWLYRLATNPRRARRMLALPHFAALVLREALRGRINDGKGCP